MAARVQVEALGSIDSEYWPSGWPELEALESELQGTAPLLVVVVEVAPGSDSGSG